MEQIKDSTANIPLEPVPASPQSSKALPILFISLLISLSLVAGSPRFRQLIGEAGWWARGYFSKPPVAPTQIPQTSIPTTEPTVDPTMGWRIFNDPNGAFLFKYPPDWSSCDFSQYCVASPNLGEGMSVFDNGGRQLVVTKGGGFGVTVTSRTPDMMLDNACRPGGPPTVTSCAETIVDGKSAMKRTISKPSTAEEYFVLTERSLNTISLQFDASDTSVKNTLDQILSTFKFLDAAPTCRPRPACLDATPRCLIPETPDMCPRSTPTPNAVR